MVSTLQLVELWPQRLAEVQVKVLTQTYSRLYKWACNRTLTWNLKSHLSKLGLKVPVHENYSVYENVGKKCGFYFHQANSIWVGLDALLYRPPPITLFSRPAGRATLLSVFTSNLRPQLGAQLMQFRGKYLWRGR